MENRSVNVETQIMGLLGHPVAHSLSPLLHEQLAAELNKNQVYLAFDVLEEQLKDAVRGAWALRALGLNVTVPYKKEVMKSLCSIDETAKKIGAVNTLVRTDTGFRGFNTDMPGLMRAMEHDQVELDGANVVMIGAGGVANAVLCMLLEKRVSNLLIINRSREKAENLVNRFNQFYPDKEMKIASLQEDYVTLMEQMAPREGWIAIQATSVGMHPDVTGTPIERDDFYQKIAIGYDIIFNPAQTRFLSLVREHGGIGYNGLKMLLFQGIYSYELWNQLKVSDEIAMKVLQKMQEELNNRA